MPSHAQEPTTAAARGLGKMVAATARDMLGITVATSSTSSSAGSGGIQQQQAGSSSSSSSQSIGGTSRGSGGVLGLGIGLSSCAAGRSGGIGTSSSSSGTGSVSRSSSSAGGCMEAGEEVNTRRGARSSSDGGGGGHSRGKGSNSSGVVPGRIPSDAMNRTLQQFRMDSSSGALGASASSFLISPRAKTVVLGLLHFNCMAAWHKNVSEAAGTATATAVSKEKPASEGADAMHAKGAAAADQQQQQHVPKRLAKLPQQGLPAAVVEQMKKISSSWPSKVLVQMQLPGEEAKQKQLLQDLLLLGHVLMVEVPSPVGCNNPGCLALGGALLKPDHTCQR